MTDSYVSLRILIQKKEFWGIMVFLRILILILRRMVQGSVAGAVHEEPVVHQESGASVLRRVFDHPSSSWLPSCRLQWSRPSPSAAWSPRWWSRTRPFRCWWVGWQWLSEWQVSWITVSMQTRQTSLYNRPFLAFLRRHGRILMNSYVNPYEFWLRHF